MAAATMPPIDTSMGSSEIKKKTSNGNDKRKKDVVSSSASLGVNLMPAEWKVAVKDSSKTFTHRFIMAVVWALVLAGFVYGCIWLYGYSLRTSILQQTITDRANVEMRVAALEQKRTELSTFRAKLENVKSILDKHRYWSNFLAVLEQYTISDVSYINVISSKDGSVTLSGLARDYKAVSRQLLALQNAKKVVLSASINSANAVLSPTGEVSGINFSVLIHLQPDVLLRKVTSQ